MKRLFLAVMLPTEQQHALAARLDAHFADFPMPGRKVHPTLWHLTLRFLGDVGEYEQDRLAFELGTTENGGLGTSFTVELDGLGAFPDPRDASVLWAGIGTGASELATLAAEVGGRLEAVEFAAEGRPYVPHVSLSHIRPRLDVWDWVEQAPAFKVRWLVDRVSLVESILEASGPRYQVIDEFDLQIL